MSVRPSPTQLLLANSMSNEQSVEEAPSVSPTYLKDDRFPSGRSWLGRLATLAAARYLIALLIGVGGTLAWQSYSDAAKDVVAPASRSSDQQKMMEIDVEALRQTVDRIAANQEQITHSIEQLESGLRRDIANLQAAEQAAFDKILEAQPRPATQVSKSGPRQTPTAVSSPKTP